MGLLCNYAHKHSNLSVFMAVRMSVSTAVSSGKVGKKNDANLCNSIKLDLLHKK